MDEIDELIYQHNREMAIEGISSLSEPLSHERMTKYKVKQKNKRL